LFTASRAAPRLGNSASAPSRCKDVGGRERLAADLVGDRTLDDGPMHALGLALDLDILEAAIDDGVDRIELALDPSLRPAASTRRAARAVAAIATVAARPAARGARVASLAIARGALAGTGALGAAGTFPPARAPLAFRRGRRSRPMRPGRGKCPERWPEFRRSPVRMMSPRRRGAAGVGVGAAVAGRAAAPPALSIHSRRPMGSPVASAATSPWASAGPAPVRSPGGCASRRLRARQIAQFHDRPRGALAGAAVALDGLADVSASRPRPRYQAAAPRSVRGEGRDGAAAGGADRAASPGLPSLPQPAHQVRRAQSRPGRSGRRLRWCSLQWRRGHCPDRSRWGSRSTSSAGQANSSARQKSREARAQRSGCSRLIPWP